MCKFLLIVVRDGSGQSLAENVYADDYDDDKIEISVQTNRRTNVSRLRLKGIYTIKTFPNVEYEYRVIETPDETRQKFLDNVGFRIDDTVAVRDLSDDNQSPGDYSPGLNTQEVFNISDRSPSVFEVSASPTNKVYDINDLVTNVTRVGWPPNPEVDSPSLTRSIHRVEPDPLEIKNVPYWVMWQVEVLDKREAITQKSTEIELIEYLQPVFNTTGERLGDLVQPFTLNAAIPGDFSPTQAVDSPALFGNPFGLNGPYRRIQADVYRKYTTDNTLTDFEIAQRGADGIQGTASGNAKWEIRNRVTNQVFFESINTFPWVSSSDTSVVGTVPLNSFEWDPLWDDYTSPGPTISSDTLDPSPGFNSPHVISLRGFSI